LVVAGDFNGDGKLDLAVIVPNYSAFRKRHGFRTVTGTLRFFEIARLLVRFAHVASLIVNVNHSVM